MNIFQNKDWRYGSTMPSEHTCKVFQNPSISTVKHDNNINQHGINNSLCHLRRTSQTHPSSLLVHLWLRSHLRKIVKCHLCVACSHLRHSMQLAVVIVIESVRLNGHSPLFRCCKCPWHHVQTTIVSWTPVVIVVLRALLECVGGELLSVGVKTGHNFSSSVKHRQRVVAAMLFLIPPSSIHLGVWSGMTTAAVGAIGWMVLWWVDRYLRGRTHRSWRHLLLHVRERRHPWTVLLRRVWTHCLHHASLIPTVEVGIGVLEARWRTSCRDDAWNAQFRAGHVMCIWRHWQFSWREIIHSYLKLRVHVSANLTLVTIAGINIASSFWRMICCPACVFLSSFGIRDAFATSVGKPVVHLCLSQPCLFGQLDLDMMRNERRFTNFM